ncbi:MAG: nuclear transport factor 2 family protein [Pseudobacteriovorax sp.]|nr:nuclear transport factor 2 family protein [Pseudobacteriovorax sp.]
MSKNQELLLAMENPKKDLQELLSDNVTVFHPEWGKLTGVDSIISRLKQDLETTYDKTCVISDVETKTSIFVETSIIKTQRSQSIAAPCAIVGQLSASEPKLIERLAFYYSMFPFSGRSRLRHSFLSPVSCDTIPGVTGVYQDCLARGDKDGIVATFAENGYFRPPSGNHYQYSGKEKLKENFASFFAHGGGITLEKCHVIQQNELCGIEFNVTQVGSKPVPHQAGFGIYESNKAGDQLVGVRIYDDFIFPET